MTKRRNPWADEAPLQWKTHVGFKQTATKEEIEKLQAQTLKAMFQASSNVAQSNGLASGINGAVKPMAKSLAKQHCYLCNKVHLQGTKCACCERCICESCGQICSGCGDSCCFLCSTSDYSQSDVRNFCMNCIR